MLNLSRLDDVLRSIAVSFIAFALPFAIFMFYQQVYNLPMQLEAILGQQWEIAIAIFAVATYMIPGAASLLLMPVSHKIRTLMIVVYILYAAPILHFVTPISHYCDLYYRCEGL
jgi:hypothetical protein